MQLLVPETTYRFEPALNRRFAWSSPKPAERPRKAVPIELRVVWDLLTNGLFQAESYLTTETYCYVTLVERSHDTASTEPLPRFDSLERVLCGEPPKAVADELDCSISKMSQLLTECLEALNVQSGLRSTPLLVVLAANARRLGAARSLATICHDDAAQPRCSVLAVRRPDPVLAKNLSPTEYQVARLLLEGKSYAEMSALRGRSQRTVANQIHNIFRKSRAFGRFELVGAALSEQSRG